MTASHLTSNIPEMLAEILHELGGSGSHLTMTQAELLARIDEVSHLLVGQDKSLRSIRAKLATLGHSYDRMTLAQAETVASVLNDLRARLPEAPGGFAYVVNADNSFVLNADGAYILAKV